MACNPPQIRSLSSEAVMHRTLLEAVISASHPRRNHGGSFRNCYNAVVLAVSRRERSNDKIGDIVRKRDTLLIEASNTFLALPNVLDYYLISPFKALNYRTPSLPMCLLILVGMVILAGSGLFRRSVAFFAAG